MGSYTPNKNLYKADPATDGKDTFNITKILNENWDKLDIEIQTIDDLVDEYGYSITMTEDESSGELTIELEVNETTPTPAGISAVISENETGEVIVAVIAKIGDVINKSLHKIGDAGGEGGSDNE